MPVDTDGVDVLLAQRAALQQDLDNLWNWLKQNGVERPGNYGNKPGEMVALPDGTIVGRREAAVSTEQPALDVRVPGGKDGYIKVHINPSEGGVPEIPKVGEPVVPEPPRVEAPKPPPVEAPKPPPVEPMPKPGGIPMIGGPGTPIGPTFVPPPHSTRYADGQWTSLDRRRRTQPRLRV